MVPDTTEHRPSENEGKMMFQPKSDIFLYQGRAYIHKTEKQNCNIWMHELCTAQLPGEPFM